jgi:short-subunit dehydrogenase
MSTYYATKNYVMRLSTAIFEELHRKKSNVHISVLCPGPVDTEFNSRAGVNFIISGHTSKFVADYAIKKMFKNKLIIAPGILIKAGIFLQRLVPTKLLLRISYRLQKCKK